MLKPSTYAANLLLGATRPLKNEKARERDKTFQREGVRVFIDPKSYLYLMGTELVFEEGLLASGFKLQNPNVKGSCGCGDSFTV